MAVVQSNQEASDMVFDNIGKREISWNDSECHYKIYNIPFHGNDQEYYYSSEVTMKLMVLKDLMESKQIPNTVDYNEVTDIQF